MLEHVLYLLVCFLQLALTELVEWPMDWVVSSSKSIMNSCPILTRGSPWGQVLWEDVFILLEDRLDAFRHVL